MQKEGLKLDAGKPDFTLLPWHSVEQVVRVLEFGAKKYSRDNWRQVESSRYLAAAQRHLVAMMQGQQIDTESGLPHAAHAACCLLFLLELTETC